MRKLHFHIHYCFKLNIINEQLINRTISDSLLQNKYLYMLYVYMLCDYSYFEISTYIRDEVACELVELVLFPCSIVSEFTIVFVDQIDQINRVKWTLLSNYLYMSKVAKR